MPTLFKKHPKSFILLLIVLISALCSTAYIIATGSQWQEILHLTFFGVIFGVIGILLLYLLLIWVVWYIKNPRWRAFTNLLGFALLCILFTNLWIYLYPQLFLSPTFLFAGLMCLSWRFMRQWSLLIWLPFMLTQFFQTAGFLQYGSMINSLVIAETLEASGNEVFAYLSWVNGLIILFIIGSLAAFSWGYVRIMRQVSGRFLLILGLVLPSASFIISYQMEDEEAYAARWPLAEVLRLYDATQEALEHNIATVALVENLPSPTEQASALNTFKGGEGLILIVHIGESIRSDRMSINGYERNTTPFLKSLQATDAARETQHFSNFPYCISAAADTCEAQICILTDARRRIKDTDESTQARTGSVLDLFAAHNFKLYTFFGVRSSAKLKYDRVIRLLTKDSVERFHAPASPWSSIPQMENVLSAESQQQNLLFFINNEGSHTPFAHYDTDNPPFSPALARFEMPELHAQEINNAYDNTIHYTDEFFRRCFNLFKGRPFIYIYVSDHGEYLGHQGLWGRGALGGKNIRYHHTQGSRVGMFVYASPEAESLHPHLNQALRHLNANTHQVVGHEHIFHTLLGLLGMETPHYQREWDLCTPDVKPYNGPQPEHFENEK